MVPTVDRVHNGHSRVCHPSIQVLGFILFQLSYLSRWPLVKVFMSVVSMSTLLWLAVGVDLSDNRTSMFRPLGPWYSQPGVIPRMLEVLLSSIEVARAAHRIIPTTLYPMWVPLLVGNWSSV